MDKAKIVYVTWWEPYFRGSHDDKEGDRGIFRYIIMRWDVSGHPGGSTHKEMFDTLKVWADTPEHDRLTTVLSLLEPTNVDRYRRTYQLTLGEIESVLGRTFKGRQGLVTIGTNSGEARRKKDGTGFEYGEKYTDEED